MSHSHIRGIKGISLEMAKELIDGPNLDDVSDSIPMIPTDKQPVLLDMLKQEMLIGYDPTPGSDKNVLILGIHNVAFLRFVHAAIEKLKEQGGVAFIDIEANTMSDRGQDILENMQNAMGNDFKFDLYPLERIFGHEEFRPYLENIMPQKLGSDISEEERRRIKPHKINPFLEKQRKQQYRKFMRGK